MFAAPHPIIVAAWTADAPSGFGGARVRPDLPSTTVLPSHSLLRRGAGRRPYAAAVAGAPPNSKAVPLASSAQAVRAVLLAMATAATLVGRRAISPASHPQLRRRQRVTDRAPCTLPATLPVRCKRGTIHRRSWENMHKN